MYPPVLSGITESLSLGALRNIVHWGLCVTDKQEQLQESSVVLVAMVSKVLRKHLNTVW